MTELGIDQVQTAYTLRAAYAVSKALEAMDIEPPLWLTLNEHYQSDKHPFSELGRALAETLEEAVGLELLLADFVTPEMWDRAERQANALGEAGVAEMERLGLVHDGKSWVLPS